MYYSVMFMAVEVEADTEDEAIEEAARLVYNDPKFYEGLVNEIVDEEEQEAE